MVADIGKVYPTDVQLLKKEIEVQGELLTQEKLERRAEVDELRLQIGALKRLLDQFNPGFSERFEAFYSQERLLYNPELEKKAG